MSVANSPIVSRVKGAAPKKHLEHLPGEVILRIREDAVRPHLGAARLTFTASEAKRLPEAASSPLDYLRQNAGLKEVRPLYSTRRAGVQRASVASADRHRLAVLSSVSDSASEELSGIVVASVDPKKVTPGLIKHLAGSSAIEFAEPAPARWLAAAADPMQNLQWGLRAIGWFEAAIPDASQIKVGVLDTGIDVNHPDLQEVVAEYHHDGLKARDVIGHGTHVAGIIAAKTNNAVGISGIARCQLAVWKVFPDQPNYEGEFYVDTERYLQALNALIAAGVKVVNLSIGGTASSQTEAILFRRLARRGITVVAAMGNEYLEGNPVEYPAAYADVFSVGSVAENKRRSYFSNTGKHIDLVAPGSNILSTLPTKPSPYLEEMHYASWSGTSMATPHVAAAAALVAARFPRLDAPQVKERLRQTATRLPVMKNRPWTQAYGAGLLNLHTALS